MTPLRQRMIDAMVLRGFAARTQETYLCAVGQAARHHHCSPALLTDEQVQAYLLYLLQERQRSRSTVNIASCALRFLVCDVLGQDQRRAQIPMGRNPQRLPEVLSRAEVANQIALALRDEVLDLETAGIGIVQIDEPALREGLPLRRAEWQEYLDWAGHAFRPASSGVQPGTQIHTHMCYSEFNDIIDAIAAMDADVISIENSRSNEELLKAFTDNKYEREIGPGVYDVHSPQIPETGEMVERLRNATRVLGAEHLWVNPDCGLKTRGNAEVWPSLTNMVAAAKDLRKAAS